MSKLKAVVIAYLLLVICLFLYSYTQVDLNLTLSKASIFQTIQKTFQYIGWFNRPLSTYIFSAIIALLFIAYYFLVSFVKKGRITPKLFWQLFIPISVILLFSYNAFSYDIFNYMFDAKIVTHYHQNPYEHKALDFYGDPWINFMRWIHRVYPYGPVWLGLTVPLSYLGFQFFLPTLFLFKALMVASFLAAVYFIGKILEVINPKGKLVGMLLFAANPLIIIETLVSGHHDMVMMSFALGSLYFLLKKRFVIAVILLLLSIGIKFATMLLVPVFLFILYKQIRNESIAWERIVIALILLMIMAIVLASVRTELQPWYLIWVLPFFSLLKQKTWIFWSIAFFSAGMLLTYIPFLYTGNWDPPIPTIKQILIVGSIVVSILPIILFKLRSNS